MNWFRNMKWMAKINKKRNSHFTIITAGLLILVSACGLNKPSDVNRLAHPEGQLVSDLGNGFYLNPVLGGDYPDPSVLKVGDSTWYMTHSSFQYAPGLLIWKSHDLVNWAPVCNALKSYIGSVFAPDFIEHNGEFYIYFPVRNQNPARGKMGFSNFVVKATHPEGPWSDPIDLNVGFIDPGHITDDDGKRYLHLSDGNVVPISDDGTQVLGETKKVYDGWIYPEDWVVEGFCLESPKLLKRNGYYYLTSAQGGTAGPPTSHMVVSSRSETPFGPWEHSPYNPVIRTFSPDETWLSKGHGTVFEGLNGQWYCMFHGYLNNFYTLGRQTLMVPLEWTDDGWFRVKNGVKTDEPLPFSEGKKLAHGGRLSDDFSGDEINLMWRFYNAYDTSRFWLKDGSLHMKAVGRSPEDCSPMLIIPSNTSYEIQTELEFFDGAIGGITLFYSPDAYSALGASSRGLARYKYNNPAPWRNLISGNRVFLKLRNDKHAVSYWYSEDGKDWKLYPSGAEVSGFHHNTFGAFLSLRAGLFAAGNGKVVFKNFSYKGLD